MQETSDGSFIVVGYFAETGIGTGKSLIFKLDAKGDIQWQKIYSLGSATSAQQTSDGGVIVLSNKLMRMVGVS